jgi:hypothetical protein
MGEYVKIAGESVKIGTCEDLYYCTIHQFKKSLPDMKKAEGNAEPKDYLTDGVSRFRFPFPDEDKLGICEQEDFQRGWHVRLNRADEDVAHLFPKGEDWWEDFCDRVSSKYQSHLTLFARSTNPNKDAAYVDIEIVQQKVLKNGHNAVVYRDPYTGNKARIEDPEEAIRLARAILHTTDRKNPDPFVLEMSRRIVDGYGVTFEIETPVEA